MAQSDQSRDHMIVDRVIMSDCKGVLTYGREELREGNAISSYRLYLYLHLVSLIA